MQGPRSYGDNPVILYLQPIGERIQNVRFTVGEIAAIRADGSSLPLSVSRGELISATDLTSAQRRLASGSLDPGEYTGVSILISKATLLSEEGEMALLVPDGPILAEARFTVERNRAQALFLTLTSLQTLKDGFSFNPTLALAARREVLPNLAGYVSVTPSGLVTLFDKKEMEVIDLIASAPGPSGLALDQDRRRLYVAQPDADAVEFIDTFTRTSLGRATLGPGDKPRELALTPSGNLLVTANSGTNTASLIETDSRYEAARIQTGSGPVAVSIHPSGRTAYILNANSNSITVIDLSAQTATAMIKLVDTPLRGTFSRNGDRYFVVHRTSPDLSVVDTKQLAVTERVFLGGPGSSIVLDPRTGLLYVGMAAGGISVVDPGALMFTDTVNTGHPDTGLMTIDTEENTLYVVVPSRGILQKINLVSRRVMAELELEAGAWSPTVMGEP